jgi:predicted DNA binding CopG/RHH family protein
MDKEKIKREKEEMKNGMKVVDNMDGEKRANEKIVLDISNVDLSSKMRAAEELSKKKGIPINKALQEIMEESFMEGTPNMKKIKD